MSHLIIRSIQHRRVLLSHQKMGISESSLPCRRAQQYGLFAAFFGGGEVYCPWPKNGEKRAKKDLVVQLSSGKIHSHSICAEELVRS